MRAPRAITFALFMIGAALVATAQQTNPAPASDTVIRTDVRRVIEDVVVTDAHGNAVQGLTRDDFSLKEDGKPQKILSFDMHDGSKPDFVPPKVPPLPPNTYVDLPQEPERGPLYVILYDMVNMELADQAFSRKPLLDFIASKPQGTRFAIFLNTDKTRLLQGFTQDRERLQAALTSTGPGPRVPRMFLYGNNYGMGDKEASLSLFNQLAQYLQDVPGRKNLLWLSGQFPLNLAPQPGNLISLEEEKQTIAALARAEIALYPIDIRGVPGYGSVGGAVPTADPTAGRVGATVPSNPGGKSGNSAVGMYGGVSASMVEYRNQDNIAEQTGGRAYHGNNDIRHMLEQATEQGASFYTLSYSPSNSKDDAKQHNIEVKLVEPSYHLAYRRFYFALPDDQRQPPAKPGSFEATHPAPKQIDTLSESIAHGSPPLHDLVFSARVRTEGKARVATAQQMAQIEDEPAYFRTRRRNKTLRPMAPVKLETYVIEYRVIDPKLKTVAAQTSRQPMLEFAAAGYDGDGRMVNGILNDATADAPGGPGAKQAPFFLVEQEVDLPLEAAWLRIAVRDTLTDRTGAIEIPLPLQPESPAQAAK